MRWVLILLLCCCGVNLYGQTTDLPAFPSEKQVAPQISPVPNPFEIKDNAPPVEGDRFFKEFLNMLFSLGLILGFLLLATWLVKRFANTRMAQVNESSGIKIVEKRSLSPRATIYVLDILGSLVVVAESHTGVTFLQKFPNETSEESQQKD